MRAENGTGSFLDPKLLRGLLFHKSLKLYGSNMQLFKCLIPILNVFFFKSIEASFQN